MKKVGKSVFFITVAIIAIFSYLVFFGISVPNGDLQKTIIKGVKDIRWGIDIRGGVDVTFMPPAGLDATKEELSAAESVIKIRLISKNITDSEVYTDFEKDRILVRFPWQSGEVDFDPQEAIKELGETSMLTFREGSERDEQQKPTGVTAENIIVEGKNVVSAAAVIDTQSNSPVVSLELDATGAKLFAQATTQLAPKNGVISIWMDETMVSAAGVSVPITDGKAIISGNFTQKEAIDLANQINSGALPFKLETETYNTISPTLGEPAKDTMIMAGLISFILVGIFIIVIYKLPGFVAVLALIGQVAGTIAAITGFFTVFPSFTLTLPGIAGIILAIGIGVDANIITAARIKEELALGKSIDSSIDVGFSRAFSAIFDGNITVIFVAIILMGAFGPPTSIFATLLKPVFMIFGSSISGPIYSFGFTLLVGVILNFIMGVFASRIMLKSLSRFKFLRKPWLYGGAKYDKNSK